MQVQQRVAAELRTVDIFDQQFDCRFGGAPGSSVFGWRPLPGSVLAMLNELARVESGVGIALQVA